MQKLLIKGKKELKGNIYISGSKNATLPILASTILASEVRLLNVPFVKDIFTMLELLKFIGIKVKMKRNKNILELKNEKKEINTLAPYKLVKTMRAGVLVLGPLLTKFKKAKVSLPGGCAIGARPIDLHLKFLKSIGVRNHIDKGYVISKLNNIKTADISTSKSNDKQEKIDEKELLNPKNLVKEESFFKKESDNDSNTLTSKEKNIVTIDLTNDEKIVYSQLGINPLIKLGKEYLTSNNFVYLKENSKEKEITLDHKDTIKVKQVKKTLKPKEHKEVKINIEENENSNDKATKKTNENKEVLFLEPKEEIEVTDEINNTRKKRRRSSASIE